MNHPANARLDNPTKTNNDHRNKNGYPILPVHGLVPDDECVVRRPREQDENKREKKSSDWPDTERVGNYYDAKETQEPRNEAAPRYLAGPPLGASPQSLNLSV